MIDKEKYSLAFDSRFITILFDELAKRNLVMAVQHNIRRAVDSADMLLEKHIPQPTGISYSKEMQICTIAAVAKFASASYAGVMAPSVLITSFGSVGVYIEANPVFRESHLIYMFIATGEATEDFYASLQLHEVFDVETISAIREVRKKNERNRVQ